MAHGTTLRSHRRDAADSRYAPRPPRTDIARLSRLPWDTQGNIPRAVVGFSVYRMVLTLHGSLPEQHILATELKKTDPQAGEGLRVSLITEAVGRIVGQRFNGPKETLRTKIQESLDKMPPHLYAQLGEICIFGTPVGREGRRYVGYCLEGLALDQLKDEIETFHVQYPVRKKPPTPHITVYTTLDQADAEQTAAQLEQSTPDGLSVELLAPKIEDLYQKHC